MRESGANRRIGERRPVKPVNVVWVTEHFGPHGKLGLKRAYRRETVGRLVDVSVSGACIEGTKFFRLRKDVPSRIRLAGMEASVHLRRWETTDRPGVLRYGVEFADLDDDFRRRINEFIGADRPYHDARQG